MTPLAGRIRAAIGTHRMVPPGGRVLVAVSGGPDSVALLHLLNELESGAHLSVAGILHVNHMLRPAAGADEDFCRGLAASLDLPFSVERADVAALAREWRTSLEDAGRRARYAFFERIAGELGGDAVATGHTRDDQAETFLLQLIRGAGPRGLSSISPKSGRICRPLLEISKAEVLEWLTARGLPFREDQSNRDLAFTRNRVRHELIPYLQRDFSPGIVDVLTRAAAIARTDNDWLESQAIEVAATVVIAISVGGSLGVDVDAVALRSLHPAIGSRVGRIALAKLAAGRYVGFDHVERLVALAHQPAGAAVSLPGQQARRVGDRIQLRRRAESPFANSFSVSLSIPGEAVLEPQGWIVSAAVGDDGGAGPVGRPGSRLTAAVRPDRVELPLAVRSRRPGDRLHPAGMSGRGKKLQDVLVDRKVARQLRDSVPLVVDRRDRIVWVVGEAQSEDFRVTTPSRGVLLLKARRLGGLG